MINKFDDDGTGLIEFVEFLCLMATKVSVLNLGYYFLLFSTQMKEREEEEFEEFIPFCFKAFADNIGESLKVQLSVKTKID